MRRVKIEEKAWDLFIEQVTQWMKKNDCDQGELAKIVGMRRSHFNSLINKHQKDGKYTRHLSDYYLTPFVEMGIVDWKELHISMDSEAKRQMAERFEQIDRGVIDLAVRLWKDKGVDAAGYLQDLYKRLPDKKE